MMYDAIKNFPKQFEYKPFVENGKKLKKYRKYVVLGMGGSNLAPELFKIRNPNIDIYSHRDYSLPVFGQNVLKNSLIIASSYSGNTEEVIDGFKVALKKKFPLVVIATGGKLLELAEEHKVPFYMIVPKFNPSNQPRMAIGYSVIGQLALAAHAGIVSIGQKEIDEIAKVMSGVIDKTKVEVPENLNPAKKLALAMKSKVIIYVAGEHLTGPVHVVNNQLNENSKNTSFDFQIPELNHHLMEGLKHPETNPKDILFVFAFSGLYSERVQKRFELTKQVVEKNGIGTFSIELNSSSKLSQAFELIQLGAYANLYLSVLYGQNAAPIPWVDWFKDQMGK